MAVALVCAVSGSVTYMRRCNSEAGVVPHRDHYFAVEGNGVDRRVRSDDNFEEAAPAPQ